MPASRKPSQPIRTRKIARRGGDLPPKSPQAKPITSYDHKLAERVNNPPVGLVHADNDPDLAVGRKQYAYDPHLDPQLVWAGKAEWEALRFENTQELVPVFDSERPIRATGDMLTWWTSRVRVPGMKSHINVTVYDSTWEVSESNEFDRNDNVVAWVKNDHLGFVVHYTFQGVVHTYYPDFLLQMKTGEMLVLETKGKDDQQNQTKRKFLHEWVRAVNSDGRFGTWKWAVSKSPADVKGMLQKSLEG